VIDPKLLDVATPRGCLRRETPLGCSEFPNVSTAIEAIPRAEWKDLLEGNMSLADLVGKIKDQNGEGT
jgi:hypothetical protein